MISDRFDAIVVGAGLGGGIVAGVLAEAGMSVLLLERGRQLRYADVPRDHLRNHRLSLYGHNTGPGPVGNNRVFVAPDGRARVVSPHEPLYQNNAMTVGGGGRVWGMQAWRFHPDDFRMAAIYGRPEGSSLANWPIGYDDLEPWYERAEREIGVAGTTASKWPGNAGPAAAPYPMPPVCSCPQRQWLAAGADRLGWPVLTPPMALNTVPYQRRDACAQCAECIGFACPVDAKNGSHNTLLPRAIATGHCTLVTEAQVARVTTDEKGRACGVVYHAACDEPGARAVEVRGDRVFLCAGAIETARLLLLSASAHHPRGLGNASDQVGRHLQGHYYPGAQGLMPAEISRDRPGPGVNIATTRFNHGNEGIIGGAMLANEFIKLPLLFWRNGVPPGTPRWGLANKRFMREAYSRNVHVQGPVQEIPSPESRVELDPAVRDRFGLPVARLSGTTHPETVRTAQFMRERAEQWLRAAGAEGIWSWPPELKLSAGQHQAGTCRMGEDPATSVTDPTGRVHGHPNLFVADGSVHVTNGGFNPALTIMALAFRTADHALRGGT